MGCDIHLHVEIKLKNSDNSDSWLHYNHPKIDRWYKLFAKMANVRNYDEYGPIESISQPKGFPHDASLTTKFDYNNRWGSDAHSASWLNSEEIRQLTVWYDKNLKDKDYIHGFENEFGYLFGNSFKHFLEYKDNPNGGYPEELEDVRFVFWFDN